MAPVAKRFTISEAGSTSSSGTEGRSFLNSKSPLSVAVLFDWSLTKRANSL